jgi:CRISPR system Cascade subunit CasE
VFLSRLLLNPRSSDVRRDLADCYQLHRTVMKGFPDLPDAADVRARLGVLYRLDTDRRSGAITLIVQSRAEPDWSRLPRDYMLGAPQTKPIDSALASIADGVQLAFRLRANPTRRISKNNPDEKEKRWLGRRVNLREEEDWLQWLGRKAGQGGFRLVAVQARDDVPAVQAHDEGKLKGQRMGPADRKRPLTFASVLFDGRLEVTDAERFRQTVCEGIGTGKAFGFGLLSVAPAR